MLADGQFYSSAILLPVPRCTGIVDWLQLVLPTAVLSNNYSYVTWSSLEPLGAQYTLSYFSF